MRRNSLAIIVLAQLVIVPSAAFAQVRPTSGRSLGLSGSYTARARGFEAPLWNPANLGLPRRPSWSIGLAGASAYVNNNSLTYGQIADLYGDFLDNQKKSDLLADIRRDDPDRMFEVNLDVTAEALGFSFGRFAFGLATRGAASAKASADAIELLLFGNLSSDGSARDFNLEGSEGQAWALTTLALSYGHPLAIPALELLDVRLSVGATIRYGVVHGLARLLDTGTLLTSDPLALSSDAEVLRTSDADAGRIWAVDVGAAFDFDETLVISLSLLNALTDISWKEDAFELDIVSVNADSNGATSTDTTLLISDLAPATRERILAYLEDADAPKQLRLGGVYALSRRLSLSADYSELIGGRLRSRWDHRLALGAEVALTRVLPLRAGLATNFSQFALSGGFGLFLGPVRADLGFGDWSVLGGGGAAVALSLSIWPGGAS